MVVLKTSQQSVTQMEERTQVNIKNYIFFIRIGTSAKRLHTLDKAITLKLHCTSVVVPQANANSGLHIVRLCLLDIIPTVPGSRQITAFLGTLFQVIHVSPPIWFTHSSVGMRVACKKQVASLETHGLKFLNTFTIISPALVVHVVYNKDDSV